MLCKIDKFLNSLYRYSGYVASFFLILILATIVVGIASRIFGFYIRGLTEYSGYSLASASFLALAYTFNENAHIRITLFLEKAKGKLLKFLTFWCLGVSTFWSDKKLKNQKRKLRQLNTKPLKILTTYLWLFLEIKLS